LIIFLPLFKEFIVVNRNNGVIFHNCQSLNKSSQYCLEYLYKPEMPFPLLSSLSLNILFHIRVLFHRIDAYNKLAQYDLGHQHNHLIIFLTF